MLDRHTHPRTAADPRRRSPRSNTEPEAALAVGSGAYPFSVPDSATILLVDDEESIQKLLTFPLVKEGYRVVQARDGAEALELGADDYITKPFSIREFRSRVRAILRRAQLPPTVERTEAIGVGDVRIDLVRRSVEVRGEPVQLTYLEFELLRTLAASPGRVFTRRELLDMLWGGSDYRDPRTIDVHVRHLREKIERDPREPEHIFTMRGAG